MGEYLLAHDLGTSGDKAVLYDLEGGLKASAVHEYPTYYPKDGWVEQRAEDWWKAVCAATNLLLEESGVTPGEVLAVSFSGQMMGCLLVDDRGAPLHPMLIWADTRSADQEKQMVERLGMEQGYAVTGHRLSASYSAAKLLWLKENAPELYGHGYRMLHVKDYIVHRLTGAFVTDYSDASGTNLLDLGAKTWSEELVETFGLRRSLLPELRASSDIVGTVSAEAARETGLLQGMPVVLGGGDGSCSCVGAGVTERGRAYNVIGTSSWISTVAERPCLDPEMRTFNWVHLDPKLYTPCGTMQAAGYSYAWYRDLLGEGEKAVAAHAGMSAYELLNRGAALSGPGANGVLFLPYLLGERSPHWNHRARGAFIGMGASNCKGDMTRAVLEGVGYNLKIILDILQRQEPVEELTVIGGGAKGDTWLQILADIWQKPLAAPRYLEEAASLGAAVCAGVGVGAFSNYAVAGRLNPPKKQFFPDPAKQAVYEDMYALFQQAYERLVPVYDGLTARGG